MALAGDRHRHRHCDRTVRAAAVLRHAPQLHRSLQPGCARPDVVDRRGRTNVVRTGRFRRRRRLCDGDPDDDVRMVAVADTPHRSRRHRSDRLRPRLHHATNERALPAAGHDRVGYQPFLSVRNAAESWRLYRSDQHPAAEPLWIRAATGAPFLLPDLDRRAGCVVGDPQPPRFASGPRDPRDQGKPDHGGGLRRRCHADEERRIRLRGASRVRLRLALCAHAALRQSDAVQSHVEHRVSVHGGRGRCGKRVGRGDRRHADHAAQGSAAIDPAKASRADRAVRDDRVRHSHRRAAAARARRIDAAVSAPAHAACEALSGRGAATAVNAFDSVDESVDRPVFEGRCRAEGIRRTCRRE